MPGNVGGPSYQPGPQQRSPGAREIIKIDDSGAGAIEKSPSAQHCWLPDGDPRDLTALLHLLRAVRAHPDSPHVDELLGLAIDAVCEQIRRVDP
jgi:hypothetical protein